MLTNIRRKGAPLSLAGRHGLHSACLSAIIVTLTQSMKKIDFFLRRHEVHLNHLLFAERRAAIRGT